MRSAQLGLVQSASGSCLYRSDGTAALACVHGPVGVGTGGGIGGGSAGGFRFRAPPGQADLRVSLTSAGGSGSGARALKPVESLVLDCLKRCLILTDYPNTSVCINATLVEAPSGGASAGCAAAVLNACALALLDSGLSMQRVPLAIAAANGLIVGDNSYVDGHTRRRLLACWGTPAPAAELLDDGGPVAVELQSLEEFVRRVCRRRLKRPGCGGM